MNLGPLETVSVAIASIGLSFTGIGLWQYLRNKKQTALSSSAEKGIAQMIREGEDRLTAIVAMMDAGHQAHLEGLRSELSSMKADIEWLAGERMIEQAISMAREGMDPGEISADTGLSFEAAHTIAALRRH